MAKLTWLGEDSPGVAGPSYTTAFGGIRFPKGEAVEVADKDTIARARKNQFFKVEEAAPAKPEVASEAVEEVSSDDLDGLKIAELRELAESRGIDHADMTKAELRDALK